MNHLLKKSTNPVVVPLWVVILLAVAIRLVVPVYEWTIGENPWYFQFVQPAQIFTEAVAAKLADTLLSGMALTPENFQLYTVRGEWAYIAWLIGIKFFAVLLGVGDHYLSLTKIIQGILDGVVGVLVVVAFLSRLLPPQRALWGGVVFALWPPAILYSNMTCAESFTAVLLLVSALLFVRALEQPCWRRWLAFSLWMGFTICFRMDHILVFVFYLVLALYWQKRRLMSRLAMALVLVSGYIVPALFFSTVIPLTSTEDFVGSMLYNSMGEYPGTFKGVRFFNDTLSNVHGPRKFQEYLSRNDPVVTATWKIYPRDMGLHAWFREVVVEKPALYVDWIIRRFVVYLPAHPYMAAISYIYWDNTTYYKRARKNTYYKAIYGYRSSQVFNSIKYIDYGFFALFVGGLWLARRSPMILTVLCVYFGVHVFHVFTVNGEAFFRNDKEHQFLELRYLLGMVAIWPIFIGISLSALWERFKPVGARGGACAAIFPVAPDKVPENGAGFEEKAATANQ